MDGGSQARSLIRARSLTHWVRPGIIPVTSWFLVKIHFHWAMTGTSPYHLLSYLSRMLKEQPTAPFETDSVMFRQSNQEINLCWDYTTKGLLVIFHEIECFSLSLSHQLCNAQLDIKRKGKKKKTWLLLAKRYKIIGYPQHIGRGRND